MSMNELKIREHCLALNATTAGFPFGPEAEVFKVDGKMFALMARRDGALQVNFKATPDDGLALREEYASVSPGYHMNKRHWNTVIVEGDVPLDRILEWLSASWELVLDSMSKKKQAAIRG